MTGPNAVRTAARRALPLVIAWCVAIALPAGLLPAAQAATLDVGYRDHKYPAAVTSPTAQKPQSKLWFADGRWWGVLWDATAGRYTIQGFNLATQATDAWTSTGATVDVRPNSQADVLWDDAGQKLYVLTHLKNSDTVTADQGLRFLRFGYSNGGYTLEVSHTILNRRVESATLDKDSTGKLWVTFTQPTGTSAGGKYVKVAHTTTDDTTWTTPFNLPVSSAAVLTDVDDLSTLVAYGDAQGRKVGVLWSNQKTSTLYFASHLDGTADTAWSLTELCSTAMCPDDHLNIKSVDADPSGHLYAVVKTSLNDKTTPVPDDPLIVVYRLDPSGGWTSSTAWTVGEGDMTRAIVVLDSQNRRVHTFAAPCCAGGPIYTKNASFDSLDFPRGNGTVFMRSGTTSEKINNPTSTKQSVDGTTGLLVLAGIDSTRDYVHNYLPLGGGTPPPPDPPVDDVAPTVTGVTPAAGATGVGVSSNMTATFSEAMTASTISESTVVLSDGAGTPVAGAVAYDAATRRVTFDPAVDLSYDSGYTVTVKGGAGGVADAAGNEMVADEVWAFRSESAPDPGGGTGPETVTLTVSEDSYVSGGAPRKNFGTASVLAVDATPTKIAYLKFDLHALAGRSIQSAVLRLRSAASGSEGTQTVRLVADDSWTERGLTFANRPGLGAEVLGSIGGTTKNTDYALTLDPGAVAGETGSALSLALDSTSGYGLNLRSGETATPPRLVLVLE